MCQVISLLLPYFGLTWGEYVVGKLSFLEHAALNIWCMVSISVVQKAKFMMWKLLTFAKLWFMMMLPADFAMFQFPAATTAVALSTSCENWNSESLKSFFSLGNFSTSFSINFPILSVVKIYFVVWMMTQWNSWKEKGVEISY